MSSGLLVFLGAHEWIPFLEANAARRPWAFALGKGDKRPPIASGEPVYVAAFGRLRCRVTLSPRRLEYPGPGPHGCPAGGILLGPWGWRLEVDDLGEAVGATLAIPVPFTMGYREPDWRPAPKGSAAPADDAERPWPGWRVEQLPPAIADQARRVASSPAPRGVVPPPAPVSASAIAIPSPTTSPAPPAAKPAKAARAPAPPKGGESLDLFGRRG